LRFPPCGFDHRPDIRLHDQERSNAGVIETTIPVRDRRFRNSVFESHHGPDLFSGGGGLGESNYFVYEQPYTAFYAGLVANNANPTAIADLTTNGGAGG